MNIMELSKANVSKIFNECLSRSTKSDDTKPHIIVDYGDIKYHLDKNAVLKNMANINSMIGNIQTYERTNKHSRVKKYHIIIDMGKDDEDQRWTKSDVAVRQLKILGLATEMLIICKELKCEHFYLKV